MDWANTVSSLLIFVAVLCIVFRERTLWDRIDLLRIRIDHLERVREIHEKHIQTLEYDYIDNIAVALSLHDLKVGSEDRVAFVRKTERTEDE